VERAYAEHAEHVHRVACAVLRDEHAAVDATQEAFARAYQRWDSYDPALPLRAWLHAIVTRIALDMLRRRRVRELALPVLGRANATGAGEYAGADPAASVASRVVLEDELARLKPDARAALVLRHYYGYDYVRIASFLGTTPGNVGSLLSRSHAQLRVRLADPTAPADAGPRAVAR
jgi:RNA polymerase sigma-70 factor (ECF subfamily)